MPIPIIQVDAFTDRVFAGNPAAVCLLDAPRDGAWMQSIAKEMNLSETAFLLPRQGDWDLRWFTPATEVDLCGHATLASSHVLRERGDLRPGGAVRFHTRSGPLTARLDGDWIEIDLPANPVEETEPPEGLLEGLGTTACFVGRGGDDFLVEVASEAEVRGLRPDFRALRAVEMEGVVVTSRAAAGEFDFVSRFFAPAVGIDEDPVTGAAHCALGPYWRRRTGRETFVAFQASARGGRLRVRSEGDRVQLAGHAVTVLRGELV